MSTNPLERLSPEQIEEIGREFQQLHDEVFDSLGDRDARYIRSMIALHRKLAVGGRVLLLPSLFPPAWLAGTIVLGLAKILENMEIGHNVMHGQWDWMNDPVINSQVWEWDTASTKEAWKHSHNFIHHTYTNVLGLDRDLGYEIMRIDPEQDWHPIYLLQPLYNLLLMAFFEWGVALHDLDFTAARTGEKSWLKVAKDFTGILGKARRQITKDYILWPLLSGPSCLTTLTANVTANVIRNVWSYAIIFCGHFPDQTYTFTPDEFESETEAGRYVRQLLGAANIDGSPLFHVISGNLGYQVEHHLYPDMPSTRYGEIAPRVREICERHDLPYNTGQPPRLTITGNQIYSGKETRPARTTRTSPAVTAVWGPAGRDAGVNLENRSGAQEGLKSPVRARELRPRCAKRNLSDPDAENFPCKRRRAL